MSGLKWVISVGARPDYAGDCRSSGLRTGLLPDSQGFNVTLATNYNIKLSNAHLGGRRAPQRTACTLIFWDIPLLYSPHWDSSRSRGTCPH